MNRAEGRLPWRTEPRMEKKKLGGLADVACWQWMDRCEHLRLQARLVVAGTTASMAEHSFEQSI